MDVVLDRARFFSDAYAKSPLQNPDDVIQSVTERARQLGVVRPGDTVAVTPAQDGQLNISLSLISG